MITNSDLQSRFGYHRPNEEQQTRMERLRARFARLAEQVLMITEPGREQSLAITKLEEAQMMAIASIAREGAVL